MASAAAAAVTVRPDTQSGGDYHWAIGVVLASAASVVRCAFAPELPQLSAVHAGT
jgi:hypothetical protein